MLEYITPTRIANAIMQKTDSYDSFLVLEGEFDCLLFKKFIDKEKCKIEIGLGCENVLNILEILNERSFNKAIGIIDSDFRIVDFEKIDIDNVLNTDFHDLEMSVINSEAFHNVMNFHIQEEKLLAKYENYENFKNHVFGVLKPLSYLKWLNNKQKIGLIFKAKNPEGRSLDMSKFICSTNLTFSDTKTLIKAVLNYCNGKVSLVVKEHELEKSLNEVLGEKIDSNHLINGHDVISLLSLSLRKHISNLNSKAIPPEQLQRELYLAYDARYFKNTQLYKKMKHWEETRRAIVLAI